MSSNPLVCSICEDPAEGNSVPPLCSKHFDLSVLIGWMQGRGKELTLENVTTYLKAAMDNGGKWSVTPDDLPDLLPAYMETLELELVQ